MRRRSIYLFAMSATSVCLAAGLEIAQAGPFDQIGQPASRRDGAILSEAEQDIDVRLAKAKLDLAKAELEVLLEANSRVRGVVADIEIQRRKADVQRATARLAEAQSNAKSPLALKYAKAVATVADAELQVSQQANEKAAGAVTRIDLERLRLTALAAHLQVEKLEGQSAAESRITDMQTELADLREEVASLRKTVESLSQKNQTPPDGK